ncbi:hypothetical protein Dsin_025084 [Dipteronia sinensis]|uniref:Uncharacterized protein n=1 Tax=Dipteronia sinensis TaxID=43782 RepID=A0AAE0DY05_9ROSI|nr:hypothetical protein Dsin_025084 [Dipteronia sinensis]
MGSGGTKEREMEMGSSGTYKGQFGHFYTCPMAMDNLAEGQGWYKILGFLSHSVPNQSRAKRGIRTNCPTLFYLVLRTKRTLIVDFLYLKSTTILPREHQNQTLEMDLLREELLKKRKALAEETGGKRVFKRSEIEQKKIQKLREEEKRELEAKLLRQAGPTATTSTNSAA